jgi:cyclic pyranopterin phosphate synthase
MVLRDELLKRGWIHQIRQRSDGPAQVFCHPDYEGEIGLIMPYERLLRQLQPPARLLCRQAASLLFGDGGVDLRDLLEDDAQQDALEARISKR